MRKAPTWGAASSVPAQARLLTQCMRGDSITFGPSTYRRGQGALTQQKQIIIGRSAGAKRCRQQRLRRNTERVSRLAKRSVKQLGGQAASQTLKPATWRGQRSTLWEMELLSGARQQMLQEVGDLAPVE